MGIELLPAVMLAFGVGAAIGNYVGGQLADRIGARRTVVLAAVAQIAFLVGLSFIPQLPSGIIAPVYFAFMLVWGITGWMYPPAQVSRLVAMVPTSAPLVLSLNASALYLGTASGALVGGLVLDHASVFDIGWVGALFGLAALGVLVASERQRRSVFARQG
jgi:predicted MFS family arabinose efflux permease